MKKPIVSVIIPVYNQEKYIEECLTSILEQTEKNIEIIIVDNNSTDNSINLCRRINDRRIVYIREYRQGVSNARNSGLSYSRGEYIVFVDPDDTVQNNYLEELLLASSRGVMPICEMNLMYPHKTKRLKIKRIKQNASPYDAIATRGAEGFIANKLYDAKIIKDNDIRFDPEAFVREDELFNYEYVSKIESVRIIRKQLYNYRMRSGSATKNKEDIKTLLKIKDTIKGKTSIIKVDYDIIRAHIINGDKKNVYIKKFLKLITNPICPNRYRIKIIIRFILSNNKKRTKSQLFK